MIVCPGTGPAQASAPAEALRRCIEATPPPIAGPRTCSFGVAEFWAGESPDSLVTRADGALDHCKGNGRNHVEIRSGTRSGERGAA